MTLNLYSFPSLCYGFESVSKFIHSMCDSFQSLTVYVKKFLRTTTIGTDDPEIATLEEVYTALTGLFTASKLTINMKKLIVDPLVA